MHLHDEDLVSRILKMQGVGYNASEQDSLPVLFKEVYGIELKNCPECKVKAFESLIKWANKQNKQTNNYMAYRFKKEAEKKEFTFRNAGRVVIVNKDNLNEERAQWMLASPYAWAIEGTSDRIVQKEMFEAAVPNDLEVVIVSTSKAAEIDGRKQVFNVKGKLSKSPVSEQKKRGRPSKTVS